MLFSAARGMWGQGTYFSTKFDFTTQYEYHVTDRAAADYKEDASRGVYQVLVADVLTGKSKMLPNNASLKMPPVIEDADVAR